MSFTGYSNLQATQISSAGSRLTDLETRASAVENRATTLEGRATGLEGRASAVEGRASGLEGRATALEGRATALENDLADFHTAYDAKVAIDNSKNSEQDDRLVSLEGRATSVEDDLSTFHATYSIYTATNDAKNTQQDGRLTAVEDRATALETDVSQIKDNITVVVSEAVTTQIAQTTYDTLKADIADVNSTLSTAIATKVGIIAQKQIDDLQDAQIATKVSLSEFNNRATSIENRLDFTARNYDDRFFAVEEFIKVMLNTYTITKPDGTPYTYTSVPQALPYAPSALTILNKEADGSNWKINFEISADVFNAMKTVGGDVIFQLLSNGSRLPDVQVPYTTINSSTRKGVAVIPNSRSGSTWTLDASVNAILRDSKGTNLQVVQFNASTLTILAPPLPSYTLFNIQKDTFGNVIILGTIASLSSYPTKFGNAITIAPKVNGTVLMDYMQTYTITEGFNTEFGLGLASFRGNINIGDTVQAVYIDQSGQVAGNASASMVY